MSLRREVRASRSASFLLCLLASLSSSLPAQSAPRTVHVFVALADNLHQGIVPVSRQLGNGEDPARNLYWGSAYGVKTFFTRSKEWESLPCSPGPKPEILERCIFRNRGANVFLVADAYRGSQIKQVILDFLDAAAGVGVENIPLKRNSQNITLNLRGGSNLVAYVGHDGLMDFQISPRPRSKNASSREAIILACASQQYFAESLRASGAHPLLWTTNLMAPEAYTLKSALDGWILGESGDEVKTRAAAAYNQYQICGIKAALRLFATGW